MTIRMIRRGPTGVARAGMPVVAACLAMAGCAGAPAPKIRAPRATVLPYESPLEGVGDIVIGRGVTCHAHVLGSPKSAIIVDGGTASTADRVIATLEANGYTPDSVRAIILTHGHDDHYGSFGKLVEWCGAPVWAHPYAAAQAEDPWGSYMSALAWRNNTSRNSWRRFQATYGGKPIRVSRLLREGDTFQIEGRRYEVLHLPGHDRGQIALLDRARRAAIVGDTVQGGADCSANWLGIYTDPASQRRSLQRLKSLDLQWVFRGHRQALKGAIE